MARATSGITFTVKIIDASNPPNYADVDEVGPFTVAADPSAGEYGINYFDFDVNVELAPGKYLIYPEPEAGDEENYVLINETFQEDSASGIFTLKGSTFQAGDVSGDYPNFSIFDEGKDWWTSYGPFLNWKIETGANASCGRTAATASVVTCRPPTISISSPLDNSTWYTSNTIDFSADVSDESSVSSVAFEVYKAGTLVETLPTTNDGSTYTATWITTESGDDYSFKVVAKDDNENESNEEVDFNVDFNVSVNEIISGNSVNVYPSPASDNFNVSFELTSNNNVDIFILNSVGSVVKSKNLSNISGAQSINFDASELANGLYFIKLKSGDKMITKTVNVSK
jgi:hypothetical protein